MTHYILVSVSVPAEDNAAAFHRWSQLLAFLKQLPQPTKRTSPIAPGVWLIHRDQDMRFAAACIYGATKYDLKPEIRFLYADE